MVTRRRTYRRRPRTHRRRIRRYYKRHVPRSRTNKQFIKIRKTFSLVTGTVPTAGLTDISAIICDNPADPVVSPTGTGAFTEWSNIITLYDYYRVCAIKIKVFPVANYADANVLAQTTQYYQPVFCVHDVNSTTIPSANLTSDNFLQYGNCKVYNQYRPFRYYRKMWRTIQTAGSTSDTRGYKPTASPFATQCIGLLYTGLFKQSNMEFSTILVTFYLHMKSRN
ncbi:capsid protein [Dipodfec virus RodF1_131]|uniref:Capsid protein n=1 Tax=Dipodfec virus RodF1_131 TaxID=2929272 RepID=A0A976N277_9VIRU|nr:capsid protein [Dipodfec virus RodF1_131]